jgi:hypothetical protein
VKVRPREAADQAAARAFLARHNGLRVARLEELVHPLDCPAVVAEAVGGQPAGMVTYVPRQDWRQCETLTLYVGEQWYGGGDRADRGGQAAGVRRAVGHHHQRQR